MQDVSKIVLTKQEVSMLKRLKKGNLTETEANQDILSVLLRAGVANRNEKNWQERKADRSIPSVIEWRITEDGEHYLVYRREQWKNAVTTPIIVSVITTALISVLQWLLPLAAKWLFSILS
ncbi:hypothetical protein LJC74_03095 [Eubacteriales bacterium OttesenSCG-928-A19]|nr:hypothetical protein [Eubacteriales bacterium OttesenSCG-928-A19]